VRWLTQPVCHRQVLGETIDAQSFSTVSVLHSKCLEGSSHCRAPVLPDPLSLRMKNSSRGNLYLPLFSLTVSPLFMIKLSLLRPLVSVCAASQLNKSLIDQLSKSRAIYLLHKTVQTIFVLENVVIKFDEA
jgi:hypothetical protein